jgi:thiol:disulfide interchange protein DsbA
MLPRRTLLAGLIVAGPATFVLGRLGAAAQLGQHYRLLEPQLPHADTQLEVIEFFWYGCPYCFELQPLLEAWLRRRPPETAFRRIPAVRREAWVPHVRIYYALMQLGEADRLHQKVYDAYHIEALALSKPEVVEQWAMRHGIERERWVEAYRSPQVERDVEFAREATLRYQVPGTPSFVVDERYLTSSELAGSVPAVIPVLDELIRLARAERARAGSA